MKGATELVLARSDESLSPRDYRAGNVPLTMVQRENIPQKTTRVETSFLPLQYVDLIEDIFHAALAVVLFGISVGAFYHDKSAYFRLSQGIFWSLLS